MNSCEGSYIPGYADESTTLAASMTPNQFHHYTPSHMSIEMNFLLLDETDNDEFFGSIPDTTTDYSTDSYDRSTFGTLSVNASDQTDSRDDSLYEPEAPHTTPVDIPDISSIAPASINEDNSNRNISYEIAINQPEVSSPAGYTLPPINEEDSIQEQDQTLSVAALPSQQVIWEKELSTFAYLQHQAPLQEQRRTRVQVRRRFPVMLVILVFLLLTCAIAFLTVKVLTLEKKNSSMLASLEYKTGRISLLSLQLRQQLEAKEEHDKLH
ncbi:unnamed protein product [Oikopleura dioica]|uniref:Uncharacterized protein n=1 Tax=Oikopleura dioica TaxID=34765 RepID=E4XGR9_OIKDI|nr:unnamed protein product [Oikopleura dioica]